MNSHRYLAEMLQYVATCGIIMRKHEQCFKGGHFDCYGISHCRGGSARTEVLHRDGQTNATRKSDARLQIWQRMEGRQDRIRGVEETAQKSIPEASRVIDLLVSPVTHAPSISLQAAKWCAVMRHLVAYYSMLGNGWLGRV